MSSHLKSSGSQLSVADGLSDGDAEGDDDGDFEGDADGDVEGDVDGGGGDGLASSPKIF
ncbi:hypothetical protein JOF35_001004 [Streptomyces demainii]|uniref:Uncharacterized protein n=1 Tax=Streptomyces demainii TaxID=588122 RepID=A0ABT9KJY1_9ACTN|nr:hypothetical protein [Streptomyces demainii]